MFEYDGYRVQVSPLVEDRMRVPMSPQLQQIFKDGKNDRFIDQFNIWSMEFFGGEYRVFQAGRNLFVSPAGYEDFKRRAKAVK